MLPDSNEEKNSFFLFHFFVMSFFSTTEVKLDTTEVKILAVKDFEAALDELEQSLEYYSEYEMSYYTRDLYGVYKEVKLEIILNGNAKENHIIVLRKQDEPLFRVFLKVLASSWMGEKENAEENKQ